MAPSTGIMAAFGRIRLTGRAPEAQYRRLRHDDANLNPRRRPPERRRTTVAAGPAAAGHPARGVRGLGRRQAEARREPPRETSGVLLFGPLAEERVQRTGAQIVWECLVKEGVDDRVRLPRRGDPAHLRRDARTTRSATCSCGTSRAPPTWPTATRARAAGSASRSRPRARARRTSPPASRPRCSTPRPPSSSPARSPRKVLGTDAFQEADVTGITLPITKHNSLVTEARHIARTIREAFVIARSGRPGPGARRHHQGRAAGARPTSTTPRPCTCRGSTSPSRPTRRASPRAAELIDKAERPLILAGAGVIRSGRLAGAARVRREDAARPVALTLLGIGGFPQSHPLCLGMMGMHGEAFVNSAIQRRRPPPRVRHALRRPGHRQPQDLRARTRRRSTSRSTPPRSARTSRWTWRSSPTCGRRSRRSPRSSRRGATRPWIARDRERAAGDALARHRPPRRRTAASSPPTSCTTSGRRPAATRSS